MVVTARQVRSIIDTAWGTDLAKVDPYAASYIDALQRAEAEYGERGVKVQILYILGNLRARGEAQKTAKKALKALAA